MRRRRRKGRSPAEPLKHDDPHSLTAHVESEYTALDAGEERLMFIPPPTPPCATFSTKLQFSNVG